MGGGRNTGRAAVALCGALALSSAASPQQARPGAKAETAPLHSAAPNPHDQIPTVAKASDIADGFTLAAVGDIIMTVPGTGAEDPGLEAVARILQGTDVSAGNMEDTLIDRRHFRGWPAAENGGQDLNAPPAVASDLKQMGFALLGHANNHDLDWGVAGMEATDRALDEAGLVHAGSGNSRAAARAARYLETKWGRVALVAMASSFTAMEPAGNALGMAAARPGISALRTRRTVIVTPAQMNWLRQVEAAVPEGARRNLASNGKTRAGELRLFGVSYRVGSEDGYAYRMNPYDESEILRALREGKEDADFEIAYLHDHQPGNWSAQPPQFAIELAHAAIDSGADEFVISGPHQLRGIEIYKGKPIFYSLGNFFFEVDQVEGTDPDQMEAYGLGALAGDDYEWGQRFLARNFNGPIWYQSVVAVSEFKRGRVAEIRLYPIDLGFRRAHAQRGVPRLAAPEEAEEILRRLQRLSAPYGTEIRIEDNTGVIAVP